MFFAENNKPRQQLAWRGIIGVVDVLAGYLLTRSLQLSMMISPIKTAIEIRDKITPNPLPTHFMPSFHIGFLLVEYLVCLVSLTKKHYHSINY